MGSSSIDLDVVEVYPVQVLPSEEVLLPHSSLTLTP